MILVINANVPGPVVTMVGPVILKSHWSRGPVARLYARAYERGLCGKKRQL